MAKFLETPKSATVGGKGVKYIPLKYGGIFEIDGAIVGFIGNYQQATVAETFEEWAAAILGDPIDLTPENLGYSHLFDENGYRLTVEKIRKGYRSELLNESEGIVFSCTREEFELARRTAVLRLNTIFPIDRASGEVSIHRLVPFSLNESIYEKNPADIRSLRLSLKLVGQMEAIKIFPTGEIVSGNSRWQACFRGRDGELNHCLETLQYSIYSPEGEEEEIEGLGVAIHHNIYRNKGLMVRARSAIAHVAEFGGQKACLAKAQEEGFSNSLQLLSALVQCPEQTLKRCMTIIRWSEELDYSEELRKRIEVLPDKRKAHTVHDLLSHVRRGLFPKEGTERVVELLEAEAVDTLEEAEKTYLLEEAIRNGNETPAPAPEPPPSSKNRKKGKVTAVADTTNSTTNSNGKSAPQSAPQPIPSSAFVAESAAPEREESGVATIQSPPQSVPLTPPKELMVLIEELTELDGVEWQMTGEAEEELDPKKSTLFYCPQVEDLGSLLSSRVLTAIDADESLSVLVVFSSRFLFVEDVQELLLALNAEYNQRNGLDSSLAYWKGGLGSEDSPLIIFALSCHSFVDACAGNALFLSL